MAMENREPEFAGDGRAESPDAARLVLLTESEPQLENPYRKALEQAGYTVLVVPSGDAPAVSKKIHPALIILQLAEPAVSGLFLVRELRTQAETRGTPVITLMRFDDAHAREQVVRAGATAILIDPVKMPMLLRQMRRLLVRALASAHAGSAEDPVTSSSEAAGV
jgi:DNA-binding response OmpR family regulator